MSAAWPTSCAMPVCAAGDPGAPPRIAAALQNYFSCPGSESAATLTIGHAVRVHDLLAAAAGRGGLLSHVSTAIRWRAYPARNPAVGNPAEGVRAQGVPAALAPRRALQASWLDVPRNPLAYRRGCRDGFLIPFIPRLAVASGCGGRFPVAAAENGRLDVARSSGRLCRREMELAVFVSGCFPAAPVRAFIPSVESQRAFRKGRPAPADAAGHDIRGRLPGAAGVRSSPGCRGRC